MKKAKKRPNIIYCRLCGKPVIWECEDISCHECYYEHICDDDCECDEQDMVKYYESLIIQMEIEQSVLIDKLISKGVNYGNSETK